MPDLTNELLPRLQNNRLPGLNAGESIIFPKYDDQSIMNIPASMCHLLGIPQLGEGMLIPEILAPLGNGIRRVVLVLVDALALHRLRVWISDGSAPVWQSLVADGLLAPLTSIVPSTTSAALTTLWTGRSAASHGIVGYEVWLKEYGVVANMILHAPMTFKGDTGGLRRAGFKPENFISLPTLGPHLLAHGVKPHAFQHYSISRSGLSQMFLKEVDIHAFSTPADLWISMRQLLETAPDERLFLYAYWGAIDGLSHRHGPENERAAAEFSSFSHAFEHFFLNRLAPETRKDTLLVLISDHGQISTPKHTSRELRNHPRLAQMLHINPTGENRLMFLYLRPNQWEEVHDYMNRVFNDQFDLITPGQAMRAGLFGSDRPHPQLQDRVGDLLAIARGDAYLWWSKDENQLLGRHGGLHADEMLVPFLAVRL